MYSVTLQEIIEKYNLTVITQNADPTEIIITEPEINRPALQLAGFFDYFDADRIQLVGKVEYSYLLKMEESQRRKTFKKMFEYNIPCIIFCRSLQPFKEMIEYAEEAGIPILVTDYATSEFMGEIIRHLRVELAQRITIHGVLLDIYGEGVLITGESGVGKSETALELVKRGHRFVADDAVEVKRVSEQTLIGSCPDIIKYFIELRGIGIIDVKQMFGVESILATSSIDLVIKLENWDKAKEYDRLGIHEEYMDILGNKVICNSIPVRPGRNLAIICESAAINHRQKQMGYNAAMKLNERVLNNINKNLE